MHPIAATATATTTIIITTVAMWLCSAGSDGYTLIAERVSHSATNFRVTSFFENTLVLRDKNMPNAPQIEPLSWKCIYIYKASCQVRIENGFKTTINPVDALWWKKETEPGLLVPPHPHPCHLPPVLGWKNAFLSALPWSLELPGGVTIW